MLLRQITQGNPINNVILDGLEFAAPILTTSQWYSRAGSSDHLEQARFGTDQASYFRLLNASANSPTAPSSSTITPVKKIVSYDVKVDRAFQDRGGLVADELAYQALVESRKAGYALQAKFFEGDNGSVAAEFDGFRNLVDASQVYIADGVSHVTSGGAGALLSLGDTSDEKAAKRKAMLALLQLRSLVQGGASHFYMNEDLKSALIIVAKEMGFYRNTFDALGNMIDFIGDVQLVGAGRSETGVSNLPFTETLSGVGSNCTSIFAVRWGERTDVSVLTSVGVSASEPYVAGNFWLINVNIDAEIILQNTRALVQSQGWRLEIA